MFIPLKDYNLTRRPALAVIFIILLNFSVFIYQNYLSREYLQNPLQASDLRPLAWPSSLEYFVLKDGLIPREINGLQNVEIPVGKDRWDNVVIYRRQLSPLFSLLLSLFMHGSWLHLLGNILFLWIFGNNIEDRLGPIKFIFFYLLCGVGASLVHVVFNLNSLTPVIGASGAISGVMGAYLLLFPRARIRHPGVYFYSGHHHGYSSRGFSGHLVCLSIFLCRRRREHRLAGPCGRIHRRDDAAQSFPEPRETAG